MNHSATYSPEDNKLRITPAYRLDKDEYSRVKAAGFTWAPKQGVFVAGMWTPDREDLCLELCGSIEDEDKSLMDRAEDRAERFEDYSDKRTHEADRARKAVSAIADHIPLGQPILIGHHSEKHARRDAAKIENGMRKAVGLWETAQYWKSRAASAIAHAKYKELPAVRARRIKGLESDQRKHQKTKERAETLTTLWSKDGLTLERAIVLASHDGGYWTYQHTYPFNYTGPLSLWDALQPERAERNGLSITPEQAKEKALKNHAATIAHCTRWLAHIENRLTYERAMLEEAGGLPATRQTMEIGGQVLRRHGEWFIITKVNAGSVSVRGHFAATIPFDEIKDYRPPQPGDAEKVKAATKLPPMCNYPGDGFVHMTRKEWEARHWSDFPKSVVFKPTETAAAHRVRCTPSKTRQWQKDYVYLTDEKRKDPPAPIAERPTMPAPLPKEPRPIVQRQEPELTPFDAMKESLDAGIQVVSAPQLFPTPPDLAARMVEEADLSPEHRILEPSGGTGRLLVAIKNALPEADLTAVEIKSHLADVIRTAYRVPTFCKDFLTCNGELGTFDRILMNPPFENGADIKHILHARHMLNPGGRLVALCANGPRQQEALQPLAAHWEALPAGSFKDEGTMVNVALLIIDQDEPTRLTLF